MSEKLRTDFTAAERNTIISGLRDEFGDREFSDELILLECQDMWRKGCHNLEHGEDCHGCQTGGVCCGLLYWEKRHPEYKDDALAKRLKELKDELRAEQNTKIEKSLLAKGYVKVQWTQWNEDATLAPPKLYLPGSAELKADLMDAVENWKNMWSEDFRLGTVNLNAKKGVLLELYVYGSDENEVWEIID